VIPVKLLLFSDLHNDVDAARDLVRRAADVDVLVGAGDFCNAHHGLESCLDVLRESHKPIVLVAGNNETTAELEEACWDWPEAHVLHGSAAEVAGLMFFGLGGGVPITPFGSWSYDFSDKEAAALLADCPPGCVLVSHSPPHGTLDRDSRGRSLGSTAVREALERLRPILLVCGHIHACGGRHEQVGPTLVVNAGPEGIEVWQSDGSFSAA
jgi:Icc-related predicted phosphoesterase